MYLIVEPKKRSASPSSHAAGIWCCMQKLSFPHRYCTFFLLSRLLAILAWETCTAPNTCFFSEKHIFDIKHLVSVTTKNDKKQASAMNAWMLGSVGFSKLLRLIMRQKETVFRITLLVFRDMVLMKQPQTPWPEVVIQMAVGYSSSDRYTLQNWIAFYDKHRCAMIW